jgi:hypothetical protein
MWKLILSVAIAGVAHAVVFATPAQAQATRTWVSGVGDDANPCSRTAPCKTFAGAISKTAAGGIINCIDPGGFGAVTITKSITLDCLGTFAGVLAAGTNGINVNAASITVILRNLQIEGVGTGLIGVNFINGAALHIENCKIFGFRAGSAIGVNFTPPAGVAGKLFVSDTTFDENGTSASNGGIVVKPASTGSAAVALNRVELKNNSNGVLFDGSAGTGGIKATVRDSLAASNPNSGIALVSAGAAVTVLIERTSSVNNTTGISTSGTGTNAVIGLSSVTGNGTGLSPGGGTVLGSYGNNFVTGNTADGAPTGPVAPK